MALTPGQKTCIETLDRSLVVAAGAGSGKTFTLTKRIVRAIDEGFVDSIERVCAITFTNKAAGELKSRIKAELRACGKLDQALRVDEAWVSTIHGMCARILRAHAVELGLDPAFKMADPVLSSRLQERAIEEVLSCASGMSGSGEDDGPAFSARCGWQDAGALVPDIEPAALDALFAEYPARSYGLRGNSVEHMLSLLMNAASANAGGFDSFVMPGASANPASLVCAVLDSFEALVLAAGAQKPNESREAWAVETEERIAAIRQGLQDGNAANARWALDALDGLALPKRVGTAEYKLQAGDAIEMFRMCVMELRLAIAAPHLEVLVSLARQAAESYASAKRSAGVLDNNDLLVLAYDAVTNHPEIAALYADRFQLVMVDEFQDTDQMQVDMIKRLAGPGACRLCTVGDAQQSIYRFRGADVSVYRRHLQEVRSAHPEDVIMLPDNFRSHADVLSLVDRVFEKPEMFGGEFMSLAPGRDEGRVKRPFASGVPRIQVQLTTNSHRGATSLQVRREAARRIAEALADLHARGHSAGDMAVLLGSMTYADEYAAALRAHGLACVISGGSVFSRTEEAHLVLDLIRVVANPYQTQSLFNVLTSPLFQLGAGDLLELATASGESGESGGRYRKRNLCEGLRMLVRESRKGAPHDTSPASPQASSPQLDLAVRVMGELMEGSGRMRASSLAMRAALDSGWLSRLEACGPEGLAKAANVYKAVRMAEEIELSSAAGPARTASLLAAMLDQSKEAPGALSSTGGDFVRIMTVHASKGLEFPIVAVAEFKDPAGDSSRLLVREHAGKVFLSLDLQNTLALLEGPAKLKDLPALYASLMDGRTDEDELLEAIERADGALGLRAALYEYDRLGDAEESKRLLYVALTRAKEALVVSLKGKRTKDNPHGTPKSCLGALVPALADDVGGFDVGVSLCGFGGSDAAAVEHVALEAEDGLDEDVLEPELPAATFMVPLAESRLQADRVPYASAHEGVYSYSSIADASHGDDALARLAQRHFVSADDAAGDSLSAGTGAELGGSFGQAGPSAWPGFEGGAAAFLEEDDGAWAYGGTSCADSDKATDLGTAFHRLAQLAVVARGADGKLAMPPENNIDALARTCSLDGAQRKRLVDALGRWFGSDCASEMAGHGDLRAEVPFFLDVPCDDAGPVYLEGEIDLLSIDGATAHVVDYKTGGRPDEGQDDLRVKHVLQAACYAYAIMRQGIESVEATFVRVEQGRADDPAQPQCVRYRFGRSDLAGLERLIASYCLQEMRRPSRATG